MPAHGPRPVVVLAAAMAVASCGAPAEPRHPPARAPSAVSVGQPITPRRVSIPGPGTVELRTPRAAASFVARDGIPDRFGAAPTVVSGVAPAGVRAVRLTGAGGTRTLPLSTHRAFLAIFAPSVRGRVSLVSVGAAGVVTRSFTLPLPSRWSLRPSRHPHRRPGAVFDDEVGENVLLRSYDEIVRRFGAPAAARTEHGRRCAYYEVVGRARDDWRFCFARDGHMLSAGGNSALP
jgi:hypothetical protein